MDMQASRQLSVTQQQAWDALNDPDILKACIPGCDRVEQTAAQQFDVGMALKIGPVAAKFKGKILLSDLDPPNSYTLSFEGQGGAAGFGKGNAKVSLKRNDDGCELAYSVHAQVGGKLAQLGQRLIDGVAKGMAENFFKRFDEEMQRRFPTIADTQIMLTPSVADAPEAKQRPAVPLWVWAAGALVLGAAWLLLR